MAFIREFGCWLPERIVTSEEAGAWVGADAEWVRGISGIEERRFARDDETVADLASRAGLDCLHRAGVEAALLGMVMVASGTSERSFPGPAAETALKLGIPGTPALDLVVASAGSLFALGLASHLAAAVGPILVIGAEKMSSVVLREPRDRGVAVLFGDGAGAALVTPGPGLLELIDVELASDGSYAADLCLEPGQPLSMNGRSVILQAARKVPAAIRAVLQRHAIAPPDVAAFLMHQANQNLIVKIAAALGVPAGRFYSNIRRYGNTSSASLLIAAAEWLREGPPAPGTPVVFAAFGAGFHWGAVLARAC
ncbi:MAG: 3-oxoacyl-[acyl-carrier-protein] synthase III C-terminal domain-containing protein [Bryobacteraceae bacterium]|jgi:3-oxoacyl-[acyl-carrier-protein] synthase-3